MKFFNDVKQTFVDPVAMTQENYNKSRPLVSNATRIFQDRLEELNATIASVGNTVRKAGRLGKMNREIIRQLSVRKRLESIKSNALKSIYLKAEIESLGNNISIVISVKNASRKIVGETRNSLERSKRTIAVSFI